MYLSSTIWNNKLFYCTKIKVNILELLFENFFDRKHSIHRNNEIFAFNWAFFTGLYSATKTLKKGLMTIKRNIHQGNHFKAK